MLRPRFWIFNRTGFYGKGLIRNEMYISRLIGMPGQLVEALPVDILSHDTVEAKLLQPAVNVNVTLYEEMLNVFLDGWGSQREGDSPKLNMVFLW